MEQRYGCTVYFDHGKVAEISSAHQEWTDDLRALIVVAPKMAMLLKLMLNVLPPDEKWPVYMSDVVVAARALIATGKVAKV